MNFDDIIYLLCLFFCIAFGNYYRRIKDVQQQKLIGTVLGLLLVFIVSGFHIYHILLSFSICAVIILYVDKRKCHLVCFAFMFSYLLFFRTTSYFGLAEAPGHTNLVQMMLTLKVVGLAFEVNTAYNKIKLHDQGAVPKKDDGSESSMEITDFDRELQKLDIFDILHYTFNYIGVLTGPYYRYRTFKDYFDSPFKSYANNLAETLNKLKCVALYAAIFLVTNYIWPINYATTNEFYEERSFIYRLFYIAPVFTIFRMRIYIGLILSECVCSYAGLGAYPEDSDPVSGEGPKKNYLHFKNNPDKISYNFTTVKNMDVHGMETCWDFRHTMKYWNICVQYWLAYNVYKRFPDRKYRQIATLLTSAFWHGVYPGYYLCIMGAPIYVPLEGIYNKLYRKDAVGMKRQIIDLIFCANKFFTLAYLGMAFVLLHLDKIWVYYKSVYFIGYIYWGLLVALGIYLQNQQKLSEKRKQKLATGGNEGTYHSKVQ